MKMSSSDGRKNWRSKYRYHDYYYSERETSPAQSHSSTVAALEWDPSADVGSTHQVPTNTPVHQPSSKSVQPPPPPSSSSPHDQEKMADSGDTSSGSAAHAAVIDEILVAFSSGLDLRPYVVESRSRRFGCHRSHAEDEDDGDPGRRGGLSPSPSESSSFKTATEETEGPDDLEVNDGDPSAGTGTSLSQWQTSGLTRSELEYRSRRHRHQGGSTPSSSSVLWVEVTAEKENESTNRRTTTSDEAATTGEGTPPDERTSRTSGSSEGQEEEEESIQRRTDSLSHQGDEEEDSGSCSKQRRTLSNISEEEQGTSRIVGTSSCLLSSSNAEPPQTSSRKPSGARGKKTSIGIQTEERIVVGSGHPVGPKRRGIYTEDKAGKGSKSTDVGMKRDEIRGVNPSCRCDERVLSPPHLPTSRHRQPPNLPGKGNILTSSSHRRGHVHGDHHHHHHRTDHHRDSSSSTQPLSRCCPILREAMMQVDEKEPHGPCVYEALELHRTVLVHKMRKEFQHLERLNSFLLGKRGSSRLPQHPTPSSSSSSSSSSTETYYSDRSKDDKPKVRRRDILPTSTTSKASRRGEGALERDESSRSARTKQIQEPTGEEYSRETSNTASSSGGGDEGGGTRMLEKTCGHVGVVKGLSSAHVQGSKNNKPVAFFIPVPAGHVPLHQRMRRTKAAQPKLSFSSQRSRPDSSEKENTSPGGEEEDENDDEPRMTLREAFERRCARVKAHVQERELLLSKLKMNREATAEVKRDYFRHRHILSPNESLNQALPPQGPHVMSTKEMRALTEKKLRKLPESEEKMRKRRQEEDKRTNRLLSQVFSRKLRQLALKGDVNILHCKSLIRR